MSGEKYCPSCGSEYRPGFERCPDCDAALVDEPPLIEPAAPESAPPVLTPIYSASRIDAEVIRSLLEGSGVLAAVQGGFSGAYPVNVGAMGEASVLVREQDVERALEIIQAAERGELRE